MYDACVPVVLHAIDRALALLERTPQELLQARLHDDMFDCAGQFRTCASFALRACLPLVGRDCPEIQFSDDKDGLRARLNAAREIVASLDEAAFADAQARRITHQAGFADLDQSATGYLHEFALPNLWFHLSMAFAILRCNGVAVGKMDFDGHHIYPAGFSWEA